MFDTFARELGVQYFAKRDDKGTWRIINLFHPDLKNFNELEDDLPDDSPAVTVLTEGAFLALMKEAGRMGMAQQLDVETGNFNVSTEAYDKLVDEKKELEEKLLKEKGEKSTEEFRLANQKLTVIYELAKEGLLDESTLEAVQRVGGNESVKAKE